jgi:chromate transporter
VLLSHVYNDFFSADNEVSNMTNTTRSNIQSGTPFEVFNTFLKLGLSSFGGPVAHIGYFRTKFVEQEKWLSESQFSQLLVICQFLPGPASSQLGFTIGLLRAGWLGALFAFLAFTLPSAILLIAFASLLPLLDGTIGQALIHGLKLVACAVVADAVLGMAKKLCPDWQRLAIAVFATIILIFFSSIWLQIAVVGLGGIAGFVLCRHISNQSAESISVSYGKKTAALLFSVFGILLLALPLIADHSLNASIADIFYRAGALVFGGGHVVLPLLEESVVSSGIITKETFLAGYGASQAIPGPMFAFSAYLGSIMPNADLATPFLALVFMFLPGFLLVLAVLPVWQLISSKPVFTFAIAGLNAAVVGLLAAALYDPIFTSGIESVVDLCIVAVGFLLLAVWKRSALWVVLWCIASSLVIALL